MSGTVICPRCEGQRYDVGSCGLCGNLGVIDEDGGRIPTASEPGVESDPSAGLADGR